MGEIWILSLFQTVLQYLFYYIGMAHTSGVNSAIIVASNSFLAILLACLVFRIEKLTFKKMVGCLLGFGGVILINLAGGGMSRVTTLLGESFMFLSALSAAISYVLVKLYAGQSDSMALCGYQFLMGGLIMTGAALAGGGRLEAASFTGVLLIGYLSAVSAVAYMLWAILLKNNPVSRVTVFGFMTPLFGVLLSALLLQEFHRIPPSQAIGALFLVCVAIIAVNKE